MDTDTAKYARFFGTLHDAAVALQKAKCGATIGDVTGATVSANVLLQIAKAEQLLCEARAIIGVPSPIWRRPLPVPCMN